MGQIALSYRRDDSEAVTGRLFDRLSAHYGRDAVFRDLESISAGSDYRVQVDAALREARVFLAIMGRRWRGLGKSGRSRLDEEADPVRIEIEIALRHRIPIIPVLIGTTRMPSAAQMPESLRAFVFLHACRVDPGQDFDHHSDRLIGEMDRLLGRRTAAPAEAPAPAPAPAQAPAPAPEHPGRPAPQRAPLPHVIEPGRYGISFGRSGSSEAAETAAPQWGGYARASVLHYPGTYLVVRPTFRVPGNLYAYLIDIDWDTQEGGLVFHERERPDSRNTQHGRIWIPNPSVYLYLVSGKDGWLRSLTLSMLDADERMSGLIATLHNVGGAQYRPVAAPILLMKRTSLEDDAFGELTPDQPHHGVYLDALKRATQGGAAMLVGI